MIKKTTLAIVMASAMMLALVGCTKEPEKTETSAWEEATPASADNEVKTEESAPKADDKAEAATEDATGETKADESAADEISGDSFLYNGKAVSCLDDLDTILNNLGGGNRSDTETEGEYCYDNGTDAMCVFTREINGEEYPTEISILDKTVKTSKGIGIGSSEKELKDAYGDPNDVIPIESILYNYKFDGYSITFTIDDDEVKAMSYYMKTPAVN